MIPTIIQAKLLTGQVINGGNLRTEHRISPETVIGQVCPGDSLAILEQRQVGQQYWYHVQMKILAADCDPKRVAKGTEGWLSSTLVELIKAQ